jgi:hypothetical protein
MSAKREDPPSNLRALEARIANIARDRGRPVRRVQRVIANTEPRREAATWRL